MSSQSPSSLSLWAATATVPTRLHENVNGDYRADVLVVGGGLTGLSTTLHLAENGASVMLAEAEDIGHGASGRNGGQVNPGLKLDEEALVRRFGSAGRGLFRLGEEAVDFLEALIAHKRLQCHFIRPGLVRLAHLPLALRRLEEEHTALNVRGVAARLLSSRDVENLVGTKRYCGGLLDPRGASVQPLELCRELARVCQEAGAKIFSYSRAMSLQAVGNQWRVIFANGRVTADVVVVATNAYSEGLIPGLHRSLLPVNTFQIATAPLPADVDKIILPERQAVYDSRRLVLYFRKSPDGRIMLGGRASFSSSPDDRAHAADYEILVQILQDIFPRLKGIPIDYCWTGLVAVTPDFLPHYHAPKPGLHIALGFNGRGVAMGNRTGAWLARKILGQQDSGEIPAAGVKEIPFHRWRAPILDIVMKWNRAMDAIGR